ncbi:hypothetical protein D187_002379 [Cystobacter fuscus DSM 2262]|uniref:Uncharacterized protein n=1 Tax=Cystobacter fuscus (strain ATCC 25194 / DSM 2262 / NBRC 100088 / M29) TaxID=1242864 RepID=S9QUG9_CYSF2|nr:hypothetical protein [Cystobacter fuscus]EPX60293.1 hypothetical protein D187_002379 [Cystobacter fuscus DSM 2262]
MFRLSEFILSEERIERALGKPLEAALMSGHDTDVFGRGGIEQHHA